MTTHKTFMKTYIVPQTKNHLRHNINRQFIFWITRNWMGPLNNDNVLQVDEKWKKWNKNLKTKNIINFQTIHFELTA